MKTPRISTETIGTPVLELKTIIAVFDSVMTVRWSVRTKYGFFIRIRTKKSRHFLHKVVDHDARKPDRSEMVYWRTSSHIKPSLYRIHQLHTPFQLHRWPHTGALTINSAQIRSLHPVCAAFDSGFPCRYLSPRARVHVRSLRAFPELGTEFEPSVTTDGDLSPNMVQANSEILLSIFLFTHFRFFSISALTLPNYNIICESDANVLGMNVVL